MAPAPQAVVLSQSPQAVPVMRKQVVPQQSVAPQSTELSIARKKKRPVAVDCKVEP